MSSVEESIKEKLKGLSPLECYIENESHMHSGPRTESHFKIFVVSSQFENLSRVERQRAVNSLLKDEFEEGLHALSMRLKTPEEAIGFDPSTFISPNCISKK